jgi:hypothetical protein
MNVTRRHLLQNSIYMLVGLGLTRLGVAPVTAGEVPLKIAKNELQSGRFGSIPAQLSQRFFEGVLYPDPAIKASYDRFVSSGFKFATDAIVGVNLSAPTDEPFLFTTLSGKRTDEATNITEFAVISTIYTNKTLFDLGASSSTFTTKNPQLQALTFYLPGNNKTNSIQIDRQFILTGTPAELAERLRTAIFQNSGRANTIGQVYPNLNTSGVGESQLLAAIDLVRQQIDREDFLTPTQDKYVFAKLDLAVRSLGRNYATFATLPLAIKLAGSANTIGNAQRLDLAPAIMPRQSEIPEPSFQNGSP